ncbi:MAG: hypothetical protein IKE29_19770 [Paenibacillus sp.]|uniref:hypothetical protein n=1 Tax=Paenibacillus sp. TaxID=58172 RepID=UPI0025EBDE9C|nr:hypothetical protein [Paenibacillus sp.]MBR2566834.1 hypothetical protein [Paenibacillus sp.]
MKPSSNQDLRELFNKAEPPHADLSGPVMKKLQAEQHQMKSFDRPYLKYKVSVIIMVCMLLSISTGFAAVHLYSLTNNKGKTVYEEKIFEPSILQKKDPQEELRDREATKLSYKLLKPGESAALYIAANNPHQMLNLVTGPGLGFKDAHALTEELKNQEIKLTNSIRTSRQVYSFDRANLSYHTPKPLTAEDETSLTEELKRQATESDVGYAMAPLETLKDNWNMYISYKSSDGQIVIQPWKRKEKLTIHFNENHVDAKEEMKISGVDVLYKEANKRSSNRSIQFIYNIPNSDYHINYYIEATRKITKAELIEIAKSFLE